MEQTEQGRSINHRIKKASKSVAAARTVDDESVRIVVVALFVDMGVAVAKMLAAGMTGSVVMFAEGLHSLADMVNHGFLCLGFRLSDKPPDRFHPFGYGKENYFWAFVVSISIFVVGAILSIQRGVDRLLHPADLKHVTISYVILCFAFVVEFYSWHIAYRSLVKNSEETTILGMVRESTEASTMIVFLADTAAIIGLFIAAIGLFLSTYFHTHFFDALTSIIIGLLLAAVAIFISWETKSLLIGEGVRPKDYNHIKKAVATTRGVTKVIDILTMYMGPASLLVAININFDDGLTTDEIEELIRIIEAKVKKEVPEADKIFVEAKALEKESDIL